MTITMDPVATSSLSEANIIAAIQAQTAFSVQTSAEATALTNTTANILHATASRKQGNFTVFLAIAQDQLTKDLLTRGKAATDAQKEKALAYLIGDLQEKKDPDWSARSVSFGGYSVGRNTGASGLGATVTGNMQSYLSLLDGLPLTDSGAISDDVVQTTDHTEYPDAWRLSGLDSDDIDPF